MSLPYTFVYLPDTFVYLPVILSVSFHRAFSSDDFWGTLKGHARIYIVLFVVGVVLWSSIWLSGLYIARRAKQCRSAAPGLEPNDFTIMRGHHAGRTV